MKNKDKTYLTKEGYKKLKKEYTDLVENQRPENLEDIQQARAKGDLSENAEYQSAKDKQGFIESRIRELEDILDNAEVVDQKEEDVVAIGTKIELKDMSTGDKVTYNLVGKSEAKPMEGKISYESPIGSSLINKKVGEEVSVSAPAGDRKYKILSVK